MSKFAKICLKPQKVDKGDGKRPKVWRPIMSVSATFNTIYKDLRRRTEKRFSPSLPSLYPEPDSVNN